MKKYNFSKILLPSFLFIFLLLTPFICFVVLNSYTTTAGGYTSESTHWYQQPGSPLFVTISRLAIISVVVSFGAIGSVLSILLRGRKDVGIIENISLSELIVIKCIGATFAIVLMLFFWSGLLSGALFPSVSFSGPLTIYIPGEFALLMVWSFIAGFSERLVPQIIENIQKKVSTDFEKEKK